MSDNSVTAEVAGLQVSNNTFSASPPGSLAVADECVMPQKGVIQPRNGQARYSTLPSATQIPFALTEFSEAAISNNLVNKTDNSGATLSIGSSAFSGGPYTPVDCDGLSTSWARMKFAQAASCLYFCTTTGPKCLETTASTPRSAGLLRMPDPVVRMASASALGANGVGLPYGQSRAYRTVLRKPTSSGVSLLSPPSGRQVVQNRILAPINSMVRLANVVTVTLPGVIDPGLDPADTFTIDPGEANFPAASETVASVTNNVITYADVAANATNAVAQDLDTGPRPVALTVPLSGDATTSTPVRIYRSRDTDAESPSDEMFLVAEVFPTAGNITAGFLTYLDVTPESVINDPLYTNPQTGEGASQANNAPPIYRDVATFGTTTLYANTTGLQAFRLQMLGVGAPDGVQNNDTITINGTVFTFKTTPAAPGDVQIVSNGPYTFNVQQTTQNLIEEIFELFRPSAGNVPIRAYYNSAQDEAPGKVLLEAISHSQGAFSVLASRPASWTPALSASSAEFSTAERAPNGIQYSKLAQPEAAPLINAMRIGSPNYAIARVLALQNAALVFKQGDGIWAVTGSAPFQVQQISVANIIAPDAACVFADAAWVYTDQGILRVSDAGGAEVVSRAIETELNELRALFPDETYDYAFAVPYETERRVMFFVPFDTTLPNHAGFPILKAYCYNNATQSWSGPLYAGTNHPFSAVVSPSQDKLILGIRDTAWSTTRLTRERKGNNPSYGNVADASFSVTISAVDVGGDPLVITLADVTDVEAGDGVVQGDWFTKIQSIDGNNVTLYENVPFTAAAATVFKHYDVEVQFQPTGHPTSRKSLTRLSFVFKPEQYEAYTGTALLLTDQIQAELEIEAPSRGFGLNPFGSVPFGDPSPLVLDANGIGGKWSNAAQFFVGFRVSEAWAKFKLQGYTATIVQQDAPVGRGGTR